MSLFKSETNLSFEPDFPQRYVYEPESLTAVPVGPSFETSRNYSILPDRDFANSRQQLEAKVTKLISKRTACLSNFGNY